MAKLPSEFVKAPAAGSGPRRRGKKASLLDPEAARALLREVILRLTEAEHRALEDARAALARAGEQLTLEQIVHRIIAEWTARRAEASQPATRPIEGILAHLRRLASSPLRTWRDLGAAALRRLTAGLGAEI
jgi:hypothetical protein